MAKRASRVQSCVVDLSIARDCAEEAKKLRDPKIDFKFGPRQIYLHSLTNNAIILYARATSTAAKRGERGSINIRNKLSEDYLQIHDSIVDLRNRMTAHAHDNESVVDHVWHRQFLLLATNGQSNKTVTARTTTADHEATIGMLNQICPVSQRIMEDKLQQELAKIQKFRRLCT